LITSNLIVFLESFRIVFSLLTTLADTLHCSLVGVVCFNPVWSDLMKLSIVLPDSMKTTFGLRNFPGCTFCVDLDASYDNQIVVAIVKNGETMHFLRESFTNVLGHIVPIK
jgi:hypothetical protein